MNVSTTGLARARSGGEELVAGCPRSRPRACIREERPCSSQGQASARGRCWAHAASRTLNICERKPQLRLCLQKASALRRFAQRPPVRQTPCVVRSARCFGINGPRVWATFVRACWYGRRRTCIIGRAGMQACRTLACATWQGNLKARRCMRRRSGPRRSSVAQERRPQCKLQFTLHE